MPLSLMESHFFAFRTLPGGGSLTTAQNAPSRSEEHTSELQSLAYLVCRLLLEKKKKLRRRRVTRPGRARGLLVRERPFLPARRQRTPAPAVACPSPTAHESRLLTLISPGRRHH